MRRLLAITLTLLVAIAAFADPPDDLYRDEYWGVGAQKILERGIGGLSGHSARFAGRTALNYIAEVTTTTEILQPFAVPAKRLDTSGDEWTVVANQLAWQYTGTDGGATLDGHSWYGLVTIDYSPSYNTLAGEVGHEIKFQPATSSTCAVGSYTTITGISTDITWYDNDTLQIEKPFSFSFTVNLEPGHCVGLVATVNDGCTAGVDCPIFSSTATTATLIELRPAIQLTANVIAAGPTIYAKTDAFGPPGFTMGEMMQGGNVTNEGATGGVEIKLPACADGETLSFITAEAQTFTIDPDDTQAFRGINSTVGGKIQASTIGSTAWCFCSGTDWVCSGSGFSGV